MAYYENPPMGSIIFPSDPDEYLVHYGRSKMDGAPGRGSGRYALGSGDMPYQRSLTFRQKYDEFAAKGLTEAEIAKEMHTTTTKLRVQNRYANHTIRSHDAERAMQLRAEGKTLQEITDIMGYNNDSSVRALLNEKTKSRMEASQLTADKLKELIDEKGYLDVGQHAEQSLGVSRTKLDEALYILEMEGYPTYNKRQEQVTNPGKYTTMKVLCPQGAEYKDIYHNTIESIADYTVSYDNGESFHKPFEYPTSLDSKRLQICYAEDGGKLKDGVIELRRGVDDLSLGESKYAQVRIMVDGDRYLKGMAVYRDDMPDGIDVIFNTNKNSDVAMRDVLKKVKTRKDENGNEVIDRDNPFGSLIKEKGGQSYYDDPNGSYLNPTTGKKQSLSLINMRADEGDWGEWADKLPSQFLAKQSKTMIDKQLKLSIQDAQTDLNEILTLTNPTVKRKLLLDYANAMDKQAVDLKATALPRQKYQVILPLTSVGDNEIYAPNYEDGETVALIRYPHGGTFEIPILKVNNRNKEGRKVIGNDAKDAVGISAAVAERLSGADFDGDTVMVIPTGKNGVKVTSTDPLKGLEGFDPKADYKIPKGNPYNVQVMTKANTQKEMGVISNLIMDMTLKGAPETELAKAVRHSMVVIDAEKHGLDYKQSEIDNDIAALKNKWQGRYEADGQWHTGASTVITRAKNEASVPKRKGSGVINTPTTSSGADNPYYDPSKPLGALIYKTAPDSELYYDTYRVNKKTGAVVSKKKMRTQKSTQMAETDDAFTLVSDYQTPAELAYASYANTLKGLANTARKEMVSTGRLTYNKEARAKYRTEVEHLESELKIAQANAPRERKAQTLANDRIKELIERDPDLGDKRHKKELKKVSQQQLTKARAEVGAKRHSITISDREWEAIQAGAVTDNILTQILNAADMDVVREKSLPRTTKNSISDAKIRLIKQRSAMGYTNEQIAQSLGVSVSTVQKYL